MATYRVRFAPVSGPIADSPDRQLRADFVAEIGDQYSEAADAIF
jgi:hypothetical protein